MDTKQVYEATFVKHGKERYDDDAEKQLFVVAPSFASATEAATNNEPEGYVLVEVEQVNRRGGKNIPFVVV